MEVMKILGIDPGTGRVGWGVIEGKMGNEKLLGYGCIETEVHTRLPIRLEVIYKEVKEIIKKYQPDEAAIEELFFARNVTTALSVGQARGVVLLALHQARMPIYDYKPVQIKMGVTGYGRAEKKQVQMMVKQILGMKEVPRPDDAADGLAVALTHMATKRLLPMA